MTIEIKTSTMKPIRNTYAHIERRFGDKPATRYQEATYDVHSTHNFHYKPLWDQDREINDPARTAVVMGDWYDLKDPRQFYYGPYVQNRSKMQEKSSRNYILLFICAKNYLFQIWRKNQGLKELIYTENSSL